MACSSGVSPSKSLPAGGSRGPKQRVNPAVAALAAASKAAAAARCSMLVNHTKRSMHSLQISCAGSLHKDELHPPKHSYAGPLNPVNDNHQSYISSRGSPPKGVISSPVAICGAGASFNTDNLHPSNISSRGSPPKQVILPPVTICGAGAAFNTDNLHPSNTSRRGSPHKRVISPSVTICGAGAVFNNDNLHPSNVSSRGSPPKRVISPICRHLWCWCGTQQR
eukprot:gene31447-6628_t